MFNTKKIFVTLVLLLPTSLVLNSCTKNTESNTSIDTESSKPKAQLVSSKDPKIPLYAVDIKICRDENYLVTTGFHWDEKKKINVPNPCYEHSIPIWGNSNINRIPKSFNPDIYFLKSSPSLRYLETDEYKIVTSSFGCYSDFLFPQAEEKHHILLTKSIDIKKEFANQREWIQMPNEMVSVRRINTEKEVQEMSHHNYKNSRFTSEKNVTL